MDFVGEFFCVVEYFVVNFDVWFCDEIYCVEFECV